MASLTRWTWVWVNSGSWWWTGRPCVLRFMGSQRVGHDWETNLIWYIYIWLNHFAVCLKQAQHCKANFLVANSDSTLQHARLPCPSLSPEACSNSCPLSQWCYLTVSSAAAPFSFCLQSLPASGSFPVSQLFTSGGQSTGASASAPVLPMNIQGWFPLGLTGLISLLSKGLSSLLQHHSSKASILQHSTFFMVQLTPVHDY